MANGEMDDDADGVGHSPGTEVPRSKGSFEGSMATVTEQSELEPPKGHC